MDISQRLGEVVREDIRTSKIEPHIYSVQEQGATAAYDRWGGIYEAVACNSMYNRLVWGYRTSEFMRLCQDAMESDSGWMLDAGCGSLAFTARAYVDSSRPVVLSDQSIWMLRAAKKRIIRLNGSVPDNIVFLHADATELPFRDRAFSTVMAMNLLHAVKDAGRVMGELRRVGSGHGALSVTTLIRTGRYADSYLHKLASGGALVERDMDQLLNVLSGPGMPGSYMTRGNMAFACLGKQLGFFQSPHCKPLLRDN